MTLKFNEEMALLEKLVRLMVPGYTTPVEMLGCIGTWDSED